LKPWFFFRLLLSNCLNWKIYCDDHSSLSSTTAVQIWIISYILHIIHILSQHFANLTQPTLGGRKAILFLAIFVHVLTKLCMLGLKMLELFCKFLWSLLRVFLSAKNYR